MPKTIHVLNGPNLNLLGSREPEIYGRATLADVEKLCRATAKRHGLKMEFRQSNHEGEIIDWIQQARAKKAAGLVINPAGYSHTSVAILDALSSWTRRSSRCTSATSMPASRFAAHSYVSQVARAVVCGFGIDGYSLAITGLAAMIEAKD